MPFRKLSANSRLSVGAAHRKLQGAPRYVLLSRKMPYYRIFPSLDLAIGGGLRAVLIFRL